MSASKSPKGTAWRLVGTLCLSMAWGACADGDTKAADTTDLGEDTEQETDPPADSDTEQETDSPADTDTDGDTEDTTIAPADTELPPTDTDTGPPPLPEDTMVIDTAPVDTDTDTALDSDTDTAAVETGDTDPPMDTIPDLRQGLVPVGTVVTLTEVYVMATLPDGAVVQTASGGPYSGLRVITDGPTAQGLFVNAILTVTGELQELASGTGSETVVDTTVATGAVLQTGNSAGPAPQPLTVADLLDPVLAEPWESTLVRVDTVSVWDGYEDLGATGELSIGDASGQVLVTDVDYFVGTLTYGATFDALSGIAYWTDGTFKLGPRAGSDVLNAVPNAAPVNAVAVGDVAITELHLDPVDGVGGADCDPSLPSSGAYLEIANLSSAPIDLDGMVLFNFATNLSGQVRQSVTVPVGGRVVGFAADGPNCFGLAAGFTVDVPIDGVGDTLAIFNDTVPLDVLSHAGLTRTAGTALELSEGNLTPSGNDTPGNWCAATGADIAAGSTDLGSPGAVNSCP